jgi:transcriptional regulator with XRE-family HTH domain
MVILRQSLGDVLRARRIRAGMTLRQVSAAAQVSLGYISEVERGQKEASSELLGAICSALQVPLSDVLSEVSHAVRVQEIQQIAGRGASLTLAAGDDVVASAA